VPVNQYVYFALSSYGTSAADITAILGLEPDEVTVRGSRIAAPILFQVLTEREEKASVAIASNESFSKAHMFRRTCVRRCLKLHGFGLGGARRVRTADPWGSAADQPVCAVSRHHHHHPVVPVG
jgi:hypothetical protein